MPSVSKIPTPLKTYSKFQIRIAVVSLHVRHLGNHSVQLRFEIRDIIVIN